MTVRRFRILLVLQVLLLLAGAAVAADAPRCAECGMMVDETSRFSAKLVKENGTLWFCDIGDLLSFIREKKGAAAAAQVKDYPSGAWLDASKAYFVIAPKKFTTPMGWGIAAFRDKEAAAAFGTALELQASLAALK